MANTSAYPYRATELVTTVKMFYNEVPRTDTVSTETGNPSLVSKNITCTLCMTKTVIQHLVNSPFSYRTYTCEPSYRVRALDILVEGLGARVEDPER